MQKKVLVVCGPTASGKTRLGIELCRALGGEVVSADSMQIYRGMEIGTAKPSTAEQAGIVHHMLSVADPEENYSVARYVQEATACVEDILSRGKLPVVVGGTGLYIEALCRGSDFAASAAETGLRARLQEEAAQGGLPALQARLAQVDPETAARLHPNDAKRIIRALEVYYETGRPLAAHQKDSRAAPPRYGRWVIGLDFAAREDLRGRIDRRVDEMIAAGLVEEVRALLRRGTPRAATAMQAIGYKELIGALEEGAPLEAAIEEIKLRSRQYAKRQRSFFRRWADVNWVIWDKNPDFSAALQNSISYLRQRGLE